MHKPGMLSGMLVTCSLLLCTSMNAVYNSQEAVVRKRHMGFMAAFSTAKLLSSYMFLFFSSSSHLGKLLKSMVPS